MGQAWTMRTYKEGDEDQLFELVQAVWGEEVPDKEKWMREWRWKYKEGPAGSGNIWLAEQKAKVVGHYPLIFMNMKVDNKIIKAARDLDVMTHPHYRRQGITSKLRKQALDKAGQEGMHINTGFTSINESTYAINIRMGWFGIAPRKEMFKPLNLRNLLERYFNSKKPVLKVLTKKPMLKMLTTSGNFILKVIFRTRKTPNVDGLSITKVSYFDNRFDDFWNRVSPDYPIIVVRDKGYLNWRYVDAPNTTYTVYAAEQQGEICGYIVLSAGKINDLNLGYIWDIIAPLSRGDIIQCLVSKAVEHFTEEKADAIFSRMIANKVYRQALAKNGFIPWLRTKTRFMVYSVPSDFPQAFLRNPNNWFVQWGDISII